MNFDELYVILADVARAQAVLSYTDLSNRYLAATGDWVEPRGGWDEPLRQVNVMLHGVGWPPLTAVVVLQANNEPGGGFWESSPGVPARPASDINRIAMYAQLLGTVHAANWPAAFPVAPPV